MRKIRELFFYDEDFLVFLDSQSEEIQDKFGKIFRYIEEIERIPINYFKKIQNAKGLFEVRVSLGSNTWRVFCFFEANRLVVILNGYVKKEDKTSAREIKKAMQLMKKYYEEKK